MEQTNGLSASQSGEEQTAELQSVNGAAEDNAQMRGVNAAAKKVGFGERLKNYFTATRIAYMALFTALSYVLYLPYLEFSLIPAVPFLKVDFSNSFVLVAGFSLGPVAGVVVGVLKELIHALTFSSTSGVGELANILIMLPYVLVPSILYKRFKGIKSVLAILGGCCLLQAVWSIPVNYLLTFPFFLLTFHFPGVETWLDGMNYYLTVWYWAVLFNLVKTVLVTVAVLLLYKPLSRLIKATHEKFERMRKKQLKREAESKNNL